MARNILVVEDDRNISDLIRMYLEKEGFDVRIAYDGGKAVEEYDRQAPDMVLLDYMMPVMDGKTFCTEIQKDEKLNGKFPIVLLTAARIEQTLVESMKLSEQLSKPINIPVFLDVVKKYCKR